MAMMSNVELPLFALRSQIASAVNIVLQVARLRDGSRGVTHITEVTGAHPEHGYKLVDLYVRKVEGEDENGKLRSRLLPTGQLPTCTEYLSIMGYRIPEEMFQARRHEVRS
jgi:pilus assembly protein CpaF